jgi:hypothetical protein
MPSDLSGQRAETIETRYQYAAKAACSLLAMFGDTHWPKILVIP